MSAFLPHLQDKDKGVSPKILTRKKYPKPYEPALVSNSPPNPERERERMRERTECGWAAGTRASKPPHTCAPCPTRARARHPVPYLILRALVPPLLFIHQLDQQKPYLPLGKPVLNDDYLNTVGMAGSGDGGRNTSRLQYRGASHRMTLELRRQRKSLMPGRQHGIGYNAIKERVLESERRKARVRARVSLTDVTKPTPGAQMARSSKPVTVGLDAVPLPPPQFFDSDSRSAELLLLPGAEESGHAASIGGFGMGDRHDGDAQGVTSGEDNDDALLGIDDTLYSKVLAVNDGTKLDPGYMLLKVCSEFHSSQAQMKDRLENTLEIADYQREKTFRRKYASLELSGYCLDDDLKIMRINSEMRRLFDVAKHFRTNPWYQQLLEDVTDATKRQELRLPDEALTVPEVRVLGRLKRIVEEGLDMTRRTFYAWLQEIPKPQFLFPEIQSIVEFMRSRVVRLRQEEYRKWLVQAGFAVPDNISGVVSGHENLQQVTAVGLTANQWLRNHQKKVEEKERVGNDGAPLQATAADVKAAGGFAEQIQIGNEMQSTFLTAESQEPGVDAALAE